jgi:chloride channel 2
LIGAAAFSAGVTRAISTAIIILELSGEHHLRTPTAVAVITAYYVGNRFTKSVYDVLMDTNKTPVLADLPDSLRNSTAADVMTPIPSPPPAHLPVISTTHTARQAIAVIEKAAATPSGLTDYRVLPVVDSLETMVLLGSVKVGDLRNAVSDIASAATMMASDSSLLDQRLVFVTNETGVLKVFGGAKRGKIVPHTWTTPLDPAPFQIQHQMQMTKIYLVFRMLKLNLAWVVSSGVLVGCVDREGLRNYVGGREKRRTDKVKVLWSMLVGARDRGGGGGGGEDDAEEDDEEALFIEDEGGSDVVGPGFLRI